MKTALFSLLTLFAFGQTASAVVLVNYAFSTAAPDTPAANVSAPNAAWGGYAVAPVSGFSSGTGSAFARTDAVPAALDTTKYLEITLSAQAGYLLDLDDVTFIFGGSSSTGNSVTEWAELRTNAEATDFSTSLSLTKTAGTGAVIGGTVAEQGFASSSNTYSTFSANLTGPLYQGLASITFRWYLYDSTPSNSFFARLDSVTISGDAVPVPEPGALTLALTAVALPFFQRRRKLS